MEIQYREFGPKQLPQVKAIYAGEEWNAYLRDDDKLARAFCQSLYTLGAFDGDRLVGFVRCVGDGEHILVVQDLIVAKAYQKRGIGSALFRAVWQKYAGVRMFQVVTDLTDPVDNHFYQSFGMKPLEEGHMISYFR